MARIFIFIIISILFLPSIALCNERTDMNNAAIWPPDVEGWKLIGIPGDYDSRTAFKYMNGAAELYLAYNLKHLSVLRYEKPGRPAISAEFFEMGSSADAYGVFSFEQQDPDAGIGQGSEFGGGMLRFWKGRFFVTVYGEEPGPDMDKAILALGHKLIPAIKETGSPPELLTCLPGKGSIFTIKKVWFVRSHILLNQRFFVSHQNILNLSPDVEAALALYDTGKDKFYLLLIRYPFPGKAIEALTNFKKAYMPDSEGRHSVKTENGKWTKAGLQKEFIMIVFDALDEPLAEGLIKEMGSWR
ncbi:MAG: hypothetical protein NT178_04045 [Proteobacteria bacterium]|nr:hypothetical protein [Pseudomonadota bacterium]